MAWVKGHRYYYRSRRQGKRVISEYIGRGHIAALAAELDEQERQASEAKRCAWQDVKRREDGIDREIDGIGKQLQQLLEASLLVSGYRQHERGEWRKKRGNSNTTAGAK